MAQFVCNYISKTLGRAITISVIVPSPAFGEEASYCPEAPYPVLYLLPGDGGDENTWMRYTSIERYAEENRIAVVMCAVENTAGLDQTVFIPFGKTVPYTDPACDFIDIRDISFTQLITEELPAFVSGYFPISSRAEEQYIAGVKESGFTALLLGIKTGRYAAVGAFGSSPEDVACLGTTCEKKRETGTMVFLSDRQEEPLAMLEEQLRKLGIAAKSQVIPCSEAWEMCDKAVKSFLEQLPRVDCYGAMAKRRL